MQFQSFLFATMIASVIATPLGLPSSDSNTKVKRQVKYPENYRSLLLLYN
jgi:hypothetical protein